MRPDPVLEFWLGLAAIALALAAALLFAFPPSWLDGRKTAVTQFNNVGGLKEGAEVRENGFAHGNVTKVEDLNGFYRVTMKVAPDWHMAPGTALTVEQPNPLQAPGLSAARICKVPTTADNPVAGCCPGKPATPGARPGETALASCGVSPTLLDVALATTVKVNGDITKLEKTLPDMQVKTMGAVGATATAMGTMKTVADNALKIVDQQNQANLKSTLASVSKGGKTMSDLLDAKQAELEASITSLNTVMATTSARLPVIMDNMQKTTENLKALSDQVRNEPLSVLRKHERSDPAFVEPGK